MTTNSAEVLLILLALVLGMPMPLLPIQILWINLVSDGLPGLALAAEPEERNVMQRPPRPPDESMFARGLGIHAVWVSILMATLGIATEAWATHIGMVAWQTVTVDDRDRTDPMPPHQASRQRHDRARHGILDRNVRGIGSCGPAAAGRDGRLPDRRLHGS